MILMIYADFHVVFNSLTESPLHKILIICLYNQQLKDLICNVNYLFLSLFL